VKDNPYKIPSSQLEINKEPKNGKLWLGILIFFYVLVLVFAVLAILSTGKFGGAVGRELLGAIFMIPALLGRGGNFVRFIAYVYGIDLAFSIFLYMYFLHSFDFMSLNKVAVGYSIFKSLLGMFSLVYLWNMNDPVENNSIKERIEPTFNLDD